MPISYKKLWKILIDKDLKKKDLRSLANISQTSMAKLAHNENITTDILFRICEVLRCDIGDIADLYLIALDFPTSDYPMSENPISGNPTPEAETITSFVPCKQLHELP